MGFALSYNWVFMHCGFYRTIGLVALWAGFFILVSLHCEFHCILGLTTMQIRLANYTHIFSKQVVLAWEFACSCFVLFLGCWLNVTQCVGHGVVGAKQGTATQQTGC